VDAWGLEPLIALHYQKMKRLARVHVDSDAVAEEVVQEAWCCVIESLERFEGRSAFMTWVFSILINQAKSQGARERRALPFASVSARAGADPFAELAVAQGAWAPAPRPWQRPERRVLSLEARERLKAALEHLPRRQRLVVGLRDVEGARPAEVCCLLGVSPENERVLLHRGRSRLRAELAPYVKAS
jgi:RNA polymerase sigma-70 factor, ECF subfamily